MKFAVLFITDARDEYHERSEASMRAMVPDPEYLVHVDDHMHKLGFAGAIAEGWKRIAEAGGVDYVFHVEGDFVFNEPVPVERMAALLERKRYLAQLVLKRQPWNDIEREHGGIIEARERVEYADWNRAEWVSPFVQRTDAGDVWTEHREFWSTNPSLYPVGYCYQGWPQVDRSEGIFSHRLLEDPDLRFAFWGAKSDPPRVEHIGAKRAGTGY